MPSQEPLPTITGLVTAAANAVLGEVDIYGDTRSGSMHNHASGPTAILFSREADRDKDMFTDIYFDSSSSDALTRLVYKRFGIKRIFDTYGQGTCTFVRPTDGGGAGPFLQGTRIQVPGSPPSIYQVSADTNVIATALSAVIPVEATVIGSGQAIQASESLSIIDPIYDTTWAPVSLSCQDGADFEKAADYRARTLQVRLDEQTGYLPQMVLACQAAGAVYVIAFPSYYGLQTSDVLNDFGINAIYVADSNFQSSPALIAACSAALESWRVLGADLLVGGVANVPLTMNFLVSLADFPANLPTQSIRRLCSQALLATFGPTGGGYTFSIDQLHGAVTNASPYVQTASVPKVWAPTTLYQIGDLVFANGGVQQCVESGESGISIPGFSPVTGYTVDDGSTSWVCTPNPSTGIFAGGVLQTEDSTLSPSSWPALLPRYTLGFSGITFTFTGPL